MQEAKGQNTYQHTAHDRFLQQFKKSLDSRHLVQRKKELEGESPCLTDIQIQSIVKKLLLNVEIIQGFSMPVWKFQRMFQKLLNLKEQEQCILRNLDPSCKHTHIRAKGSSAAEDVESDPVYIRQVLEKVHPGIELPESEPCINHFLDLDFAIRALSATQVTDIYLKNMLHTKLLVKILKKQPNRKVEDVKAELNDNLNKKFYNPNEEGHLGNRFMLISVGENDLTVDITTYQNLRRQHIHSPDRIQISFNVIPIKKEDGSKTIVLTHQAFQRNKQDYLPQEKPLIRPDLTLLDLAQTLLDRKAKLVHFTSLETMDNSGWFKLMQYYVGGYRAADDETRLLSIAATQGSERFFEQALYRFCRNHFQGDERGIYFYLLNCLLCLNRYGFDSHANIIHAFKPEWFGATNEESLKLSRMLSCVGLLMLSTELQQGDGFNVEFTFNSGKPALRWTYRIEKKSYSFLTLFNPRQCLMDFVDLFQDSPLVFSVLMKGRKTKQDLSLMTSILKYLQVNETDLIRFIHNLGDESKPEVAKMAQFWIPLAQKFRDVPKFTSTAEVLNFVRLFLPTVTRRDFQQGNRTFVVDLLKKCLSTEDPQDVMKVLSDVDQWKTMHPWIFEGNECHSFQILCLKRMEFLLKKPNQKLSIASPLLNSVKSESLKRLAGPFFRRVADHYMTSSEDASAALRIFNCLKEWNVSHPWIFSFESFEGIQEFCVKRMEQLLAGSTLGEAQSLLNKIQTRELQKVFALHFLQHGNEFLQSSEHHGVLLGCLNNHPWIYEDNLEEAYPFIESLLIASVASANKTVLAQTFIELYIKKGKQPNRIHQLLAQVKFAELPAEIKKSVRVIYRPLVLQLYEKKEYGEIIKLYRWLGISGTTTPAQFKSILPESLDQAFKKELRNFLRNIFEFHIASQVDSSQFCKHFDIICEWNKTFSWLFETEDNFIQFQKIVFKKIEELLLLDAANALVSLKEILSHIDQSEHPKIFSSHARAIISRSLASSEQQIIWNLISINQCLESYPWIDDGDGSFKCDLVRQVISIIARALDDPRHDHRWYNLADVYLRALLTLSTSGVEAIHILLKPCMRTHLPSKELVECLQERVDPIIHALQESKRYPEVIEFEIFLYLLDLNVARNESSNLIILNAFKETDAEEFNTDKFLAFKRFLNEATLPDGEIVQEIIMQIVKSLLSRAREIEVAAVLSILIKRLPRTHEACANQYFTYMATKKITKADLGNCKTLLLDPVWTSIRTSNAALTEKFQQAVFDVWMENHCSHFKPYEAFTLIRGSLKPNFNRWFFLLQHFDGVKQAEKVREIWECFVALAIPNEKALYVKTWMLGLRRAFDAGVVPTRLLASTYEPIRTLVEALSESDVSLEVHLGLFRMLSKQPSEVNCWPLVESIISRYKTFPKDMEFDKYCLHAYSPKLEEFYQSCKSIFGLMVAAEASKVAIKPDIIRAGIDCLKQSKRFKAASQVHQNGLYSDSMKYIQEIYRRLEKLKPSPVDSWDEVYNSFVETEYGPLINIVLAYLNDKLKPVGKDLSVTFPPFKCHLEPSALLFLFEYLLEANGLPSFYRILPRRIIGHPTTACILKNHVKKEHWVKEILYRCSGRRVLVETADDYQNELKDILLYVNAPEGVASNPVIRSLYAQLIGTLANSKGALAASQVQALYLHCALGRTPYEKKYQMATLKIKTSNKILDNQAYKTINPRSPYIEQESWRIGCLEFQAKILEQYINHLMVHDSLNDDDEMGDFLKILIETQIEQIIEMCKLTVVPDNLCNPLSERIKRFMLTLMTLPKSKKDEIKILNEIYSYLDNKSCVFQRNSHLFSIIRTLHVHLAKQYTLKEVPHQFAIDLSMPERWLNLSQLAIAYTNAEYDSRDISYLLRMLLRLLQDETTIQIDLLEQIYSSIVAHLKKGPAALKGEKTETLSQFSLFVDRIVNLCLIELNNSEQSTYVRKQIQAFLLSSVISSYATLAAIFHEADRAKFKPALLAIKILSNLNSALRRDEQAVECHISYLNMFSQFVLYESANCYHYEKYSDVETIVFGYAELLMLRGWKLNKHEIEHQSNGFKRFLINLQELANPEGDKLETRKEKVKELTIKMIAFMNENHILDSLDSDSKKILKNLLD